MDKTLFDTPIRYSDMINRNIVFASEYREAFASLIDDVGDIDTIVAVTNYARSNVSTRNQQGDFYYTAAIGYPFQTKPFMQTRYSDGTFPVWYGSKTIETTIYETVYHATQFILADHNAMLENKITKKRSVFNVFCNTILIDLISKSVTYPEILANDYKLTQQIGKKVQEEGLNGIVSPSARDKSGVNFNIFKASALQGPTPSTELTYHIYPEKGYVEVLGLSKKLTIKLDFQLQ